jgi:hypothetical protein
MHCGAEVTESSTNKQHHLSSDLFSPDLNRDLSGKEGLREQPRPGVDSNVSASSLLSVVAVNTAISPGFCTSTRRFQD